MERVLNPAAVPCFSKVKVGDPATCIQKCYKKMELRGRRWVSAELGTMSESPCCSESSESKRSPPAEVQGVQSALDFSSSISSMAFFLIFIVGVPRGEVSKQCWDNDTLVPLSC